MSRSSLSTARPWTEQQLIADVEAGPQGPRVGSFFDFDGTLIDGYSLSAFARHHLRSLQIAPADLGRMLLTGLHGVTTEEDFERFTVLSMRAWAGRSEDELAELGERLFVQAISGSLYPEAWRLVQAHQRAGHTIVLASSATRFQVEPAARAMVLAQKKPYNTPLTKAVTLLPFLSEPARAELPKAARVNCQRA